MDRGQMRERRMTPKGQMSSSGAGPPIAHLPPHLKMMFEAGPPLPYHPPITKKKPRAYTGVADFLDQFESGPPPERIIQETPKQRHERIRNAKLKENEAKNEQLKAEWEPNNNEKATENAYNTLFVGRLSYDTDEKKLRREFEQFGPIKSLRLVQDLEGDSRGYAFIEFEREPDMRSAYKYADGRKIDGRRVLVDVERGRTVRNWLPRRLGGGLGGTRAGGEDVNVKMSGRDPPPGTEKERARSRSQDRNSRSHGGGGRDNYRGGDKRFGDGGRRGDDRRRRSRSRERGGDRFRGGDRGGNRGGDRYGGGGDRYGGGDKYGGGDRYGGGRGADKYGGGGGGGDKYGGGGGDKYGGGGDRRRSRSKERRYG